MPPKAEKQVALVKVMPAPEAKELEAQAAQIAPIQAYQTGSIVCEEDAKRASDRLIVVRAVAEAMDAARMKLKRPHLDAEKQIDSAFKPYLDRCKNLDGSIAAELLRWKRQETLRVEAERQEAEKKRLAAQTEQDKGVDAVREQARQQAEEMGLEGDDAKDWEEMAAEGAQKAAEPLPAVVETPMPSRRVETHMGATQVVQGPWTHYVTDLDSLPACFRRLNPAAFPDLKMWERAATGMLGGLNVWRADDEALKWAVKAGVRKIPGVRIYQQEVLKRGR